MVSKKDRLEFVQQLYEDEKERIYYSHNVVNIKKAQNREEELFSLKEYLPNLLRSFLSIDYYTRMEEYGVIDEVLEKTGETRKYTREESVIEYINWIDTHKEFHDLLNEKEVKEIGDLVEELEKEIEALKKIIKSE